MTRKLGFIFFLCMMTFNMKAIAEISCSVTTEAWNNGYLANVTVTNNGDTALSNWRVTLQFNQAPSINNAWSSDFVVNNNTIEASNLSWNGHLNAGDSAFFGFVGSHNGDFSEPTCYADPQNEALANYLRQGLLNHLGSRTGTSSSTGSSSSSSAASSSSAGSASQEDDITNTQEGGVDEADIIESDGTHLFTVQRIYNSGSSSSSSSSSGSTPSPTITARTTVHITAHTTDSVTASTEIAGSFSLAYDSTQMNLSGAYLRQTEEGNTLAVVGETSNAYSYGWYSSYNGYYPYYQTSNKVSIVLTNTDDPSAMSEIERLSFDGSLLSSRRIGNMLYVASRYSANMSRLGLALNNTTTANSQNIELATNAALEDMLPHIYDPSGNSKPLLSASDCTVPEWPEKADAYAGSLVVLTRINLDDTSEIESRCLPASATDIYASQEAIYAFGYGYYSGMKIYKFAIDDAMEYRGSIKLTGSIPCRPASYCFGEKDGVLRVLYRATNSSGASSSISSISSSSSSSSTGTTPYRLALIQESAVENNALEIVSTLPNESRPESIGKPGELIYSMRSFGDHAYIVTFEKVDPLYAIDLSNPADPFIAGEIEVTGFSNYLHPVGENLLLGIGKDAIFDEARNITWFQGVKVELFDISDPTMLRSLGSEIIGKRGSSTTVNYDPRSFAFRNDDNGIRFSLPVQVKNRLPPGGNPDLLNQYYYWDHNGLYVYEIETNAQGDAQLTQLGILKAASAAEGQMTYSGPSVFNDRGVLDDDAVYYLHNFSLYSSLVSELE